MVFVFYFIVLLPCSTKPKLKLNGAELSPKVKISRASQPKTKSILKVGMVIILWIEYNHILKTWRDNIPPYQNTAIKPFIRKVGNIGWPVHESESQVWRVLLFGRIEIIQKQFSADWVITNAVWTIEYNGTSCLFIKLGSSVHWWADSSIWRKIAAKGGGWDCGILSLRLF